MSKQPDALRLAQDLDAYHMRAEHKQAAAELRRQHALIAELVEALAKIAAIPNQEFGADWEEIEEARGIADAAIAKAVQQ